MIFSHCHEILCIVVKFKGLKRANQPTLVYLSRNMWDFEQKSWLLRGWKGMKFLALTDLSSSGIPNDFPIKLSQISYKSRKILMFVGYITIFLWFSYGFHMVSPSCRPPAWRVVGEARHQKLPGAHGTLLQGTTFRGVWDFFGYGFPMAFPIVS